MGGGSGIFARYRDCCYHFCRFVSFAASAVFFFELQELFCCLFTFLLPRFFNVSTNAERDIVQKDEKRFLLSISTKAAIL